MKSISFNENVIIFYKENFRQPGNVVLINGATLTFKELNQLIRFIKDNKPKKKERLLKPKLVHPEWLTKDVFDLKINEICEYYQISKEVLFNERTHRNTAIRFSIFDYLYSIGVRPIILGHWFEKAKIGNTFYNSRKQSQNAKDCGINEPYNTIKKIFEK